MRASQSVGSFSLLSFVIAEASPRRISSKVVYTCYIYLFSHRTTFVQIVEDVVIVLRAHYSVHLALSH